MAFWDNLGQKASETTAKAVQKAKEISDVAKLNSMISEEETKINNIYNQIGKLYVTMHPHDCEKEFSDMIASIKQSDEKIISYRQQIQDIKGIIHCEKCGAEVPTGSAFCSSCGAEMPKIKVTNVDETVQCEHCGAKVKKEMKFCTNCGSPIIQSESEIDAEEAVLDKETE